MSELEVTTAAPVVNIKKRTRPTNQNRRIKSRDEGSDESGEESTEIMKPKIRTLPINTPTIQSTKGNNKEDNNLSMNTTTTTTTVYSSTREIVPKKYAGDATHTTEIDTATDRDARAILERNIKLNAEGVLDGEVEKIYRGQAGYKNYLPKDMAQVGTNKYTGTQGPLRATTSMRATAVFDYKPDICKDYKETGYCGFGDSCKFLHDRGDYKSGWQLEKEWEEAQKRKKKKLEASLKGFGAEDLEEEEDEHTYEITSDKPLRAPVNVDDGDEADIYAIDLSDEEKNGPSLPLAIGRVDRDGLPFACYLCRDRFVDPVVTICSHYFCRKCIESDSRNNKVCPICQKKTFGVFNKADKLIRKMKKMRANGLG